VVERVFAETDGRGADAVILAVGGNALIKTAMDAVRPGGKVMLFAQTQHGEATSIPARFAWTRRRCSAPTRLRSRFWMR
jgi:L-iditol 2-dehydrogenase